MTSRALRVVVQEFGPSDFSWTLVRKESSSLSECVAASSIRFSDYDGALDAGFVALQAFCSWLLTSKASTKGAVNAIELVGPCQRAGTPSLPR